MSNYHNYGPGGDQPEDVTDSSTVPPGSVLRTRTYGDYVLQRFKGEGSIWRCTSHLELGKFTSEAEFEKFLSTITPTGTIGIFKYIRGSDQIWRVYRVTTGRDVPQELRCGFGDEQELQLAVFRYQGTPLNGEQR